MLELYGFGGLLAVTSNAGIEQESYTGATLMMYLRLDATPMHQSSNGLAVSGGHSVRRDKWRREAGEGSCL